MITSENHLHDIWLIKKVVDSIFDNLKSQYDFLDYQVYDNKFSDCIYLGIIKNEIIIYVFISNREGYELNILEKGKEKWMRKTFNFFVSNIFPPFSEKEKKYFKERHNQSLKYEKYSFEFYENMINMDIFFLKTHYPEVLERGFMPIL